jgi:glycosyltransferase involved in cell wall biosynthesis
MSIAFTVAVITYNGAKRIPEVLDCLLYQEVKSIDWEVLVVDNNSTDETAQVVQEYAKNWREDSQVRYAFEERQGAAYGRYRAVAEAQSKSLIGFLDDDNLPGTNWLRECVKFADENPKVGAYGGIIHPKLDSDPPEYFNQIKRYLTVINRGDQPFQYKSNQRVRSIPPAPGVVIRKEAWNEGMPLVDNILIAGRDPNTMVAGEDAEMMYRIQNTQWEVWHNPKMEIWHHIYPHRLEKDYLLKLARGYGLSNHLIRLTRYPDWKRVLIQIMIPFYVIREGTKLILFYYKNKNIFDKNFATKCELECKIGQLYSPILPIYTRIHLFKSAKI